MEGVPALAGVALEGFGVLPAQTIPWCFHRALTPLVFAPTRGLGGVFRLAFTGRKPQVIREKPQDASKKPRVDLLV